VISTRRAIKAHKPHHLRGYRWTHRFVDRIVANSERVARFTVEREGAPAHKVLTIPNGVDLRRFAGVGRGRFRSRWGIDPQALVVAAVGSIKPVKGQDVLVEAAIPWLRREPRAHLVLAGDRTGGFAEDLEARVAEAGLRERVHWPGPVEDVPGLLADADLFALPSRSEGMSNALLEAMAGGLAVVATDVGGNRECLDDGACGMLVPAEDPGALGAALESLAADPRRRGELGGRARARVERHYDLERILDRVEDLYRELLR
jgi:glycosyltransferase involved in cell wall biosynthesis